jgi:protein-disulfide isomerase
VIVATLVVVTHRDLPPKHTTESGSPTPKNMASDGILLTGRNGKVSAVQTPAVAIGSVVPADTSAHPDTVNIVEYIDFQCPYCLQFEQTNLSDTAQLVATGNVTFEIHPIAILDRSSQGTRYSSRAANAAACVANFDPDAFLNVTASLFQYQPTEGSSGLTNAKILTVLGKADVSGGSITKCVENETFRDWVTATTDAETNGSFEHVATKPTSFVGTPTVFVNGVQFTDSLTDRAAFVAFVTAQSQG